jgi:LysM repeat protein
MQNEQRSLRVFLCHAHSDAAAVRALYLRLKREGVDVWLDKEKLLPGQDWEYEIRRAVRESDVVVVCLSKHFNQTGFRQKEVRLALDTAMEQPEGEIFIIPARLEECDILESLRKWHWVDLFEDNGYEVLMRALRTRADRVGANLQVKKSWFPKVSGQGPEKSPFQGKQKEPKETLTTVSPKRRLKRMGNAAILAALIACVGTIIGAWLNSRLTALLSTPPPTLDVNQISTQAMGTAYSQSGMFATQTAHSTISAATLTAIGPIRPRPSTYILEEGETPYCIARRFNVDPSELYSLNGLIQGANYYPGHTLKIPQTGSYPGNRALRNHPATYDVASSSETINSIACLFGDVDPSAIAQANDLPLDASLTAGQQLAIP